MTEGAKLEIVHKTSILRQYSMNIGFFCPNEINQTNWQKCRILRKRWLYDKSEKYLNELIKEKNDGFPKVIIGIRRCGKSFLLKDIYSSYLMQNGVKENEIILIDLDDDKNSRLRNPIELGNYVRKVTCTKQLEIKNYKKEIRV